jgi:hypothetical protein
MNHLLFLIAAGLSSTCAIAAPLLTIACEAPLGSHVQYGSYPSERVQAQGAGLPEPAARLTAPTPDGFTYLPTFVVDSDRTNLRVAWSETPSDAANRARSRSLGVPYCCAPPSSSKARVVLFSSEQISAVEVSRGAATTLYSFFPNLGTAFVSVHQHEPSGKSARQLSLFSSCKYIWVGRRQ